MKSVREAALGVLKDYDAGEDVKAAISDLRQVLAGIGGPTYVTPQDRYIVALEAGYDEGVESPEQAVAAALALTRDLCSPDTQWHVYDCETGEGSVIEQGDAEDMVTADGNTTFDLGS